jgi:protein-disulfide isomerase
LAAWITNDCLAFALSCGQGSDQFAFSNVKGFFFMITRRSALAVTATGLALAPLQASAQQAVDIEKLHAPSPLGERVEGKADAPVTIVEYASLTCPHCGAFWRDTHEHLKKTYIDTGKVRLIYRGFVLNKVDLSANVLVRCLPEDKYFPAIDAMFTEQEKWAYSNNPYEALKGMAKQFGFTEQSFDACLSNADLTKAIFNERESASKVFGVDSTPTFFINGVKVSGAMSTEELDKKLQPLLSK